MGMIEHAYLTHRAFGPILRLSGCVNARPTTAERIRKMMHPFREASGRPISHAIYPTDSQRPGAVEASPQVEQCSDGGSVRRTGRPTVAQIHGGGNTARNQSAHPVLRDGSTRARCGHDRTNLEPDARHGRNDRARRRIVSSAALAEDLTFIVREALRAAALAPTYIDALDICGAALRSIIELSHEKIDRPTTVALTHQRECLISALRATEMFRSTLTTGTFEYETASARVVRLNAELLKLDTQVQQLAEVRLG